jgi:hypothetical protein
MYADIEQAVMLQNPHPAQMETDQYSHYFAIRKSVRLIPVLYRVVLIQLMFEEGMLKFF